MFLQSTEDQNVGLERDLTRGRVVHRALNDIE